MTRTPPNARRSLVRRWLLGLMPLALVGMGVPAAQGADVPHNALFLMGEAGSEPARNRSHNYDPSNMTFSVRSVSDPAELWLSVRASQSLQDPWWELRFAAPAGSLLAVGSYIDTQHPATREAGRPGLYVYGDGGHGAGACGSTSGNFVVHELVRDSHGTVTAFAASFLQSCSATPTPGHYLVGEIRYNSAVGWQAWSFSQNSLDLGPVATGTTSARGAVVVQATGTEPVTLSAAIDGQHASEFSLADPAGCLESIPPGATCELEVYFAPTAVGARTATLALSIDGFVSAHLVALTGGGRTPTTTTLAAPTGGLYPRGTVVDYSVSPNASGDVRIEAGDDAFAQGGVANATGNVLVVLPPGPLEIFARYLTSSTFFESVSAPVGVTTLVETETLLLAGPESDTGADSYAVFGEEVELYASVQCAGSYDLSGGTLAIVDTVTGQTLATGGFDGSRVEARARLRLYESETSHHFEARYSGHGQCAASSDTVWVNTVKIRTTLSMTLPAPAYYPGPLAFRARVDPIPDGGEVIFRDGTTELGRAAVSLADGSAVANLTLLPGTRSVSATYSGTAAFAIAHHHALSHRVSIQTAVDISAEPGSVNEGAATLVTGTVRAIGTGHPGAGELRMMNLTTGAFLGSVNVSSGNRALAQSLTLSEGVHRIEVAYRGSGDYDPSSAVVTVVVGPPSADSQPPAGSVVINGGSSYTSNPLVTLALSASDPSPGSGVIQMQLSTTANQWPAAWETFTATRQLTLTGSDGAKHVYAHFRDAAGNVSATASAGVVLDTVKPVAPQPDQAVAVGATIGPAVPVVVTFATTDDTSGVATYDLGRSSDGGASYASVQLQPGQSSTTQSLAPGKRDYRFRARAGDQAGNQTLWTAGPSFKVRLIQESASAVAYAGSWKRKATSRASGGAIRQSSAAGARATFTFVGREAALIARVGPDSGRAAVFADGAQVGTIDLYAPTVGWRRVMLTVDLTPGVTHRVEVRVLGTKQAASSGVKIAIDGLAVIK